MLTFPTIAEQVLEEFRSRKAQSLAAAARKRKPHINKRWPAVVVYTFDDDSSLEVSGRGKNYKVEAKLP